MSETIPALISANDEDSTAIQQNPNIDLNSYHLKWAGETEPVERVLGQAADFLGRPDFDKPVIVSTDGGFLWKKLIRDVQNMMRRDGSQHLEHFEQPMNRLVGIRGRIRGLQDFGAYTLARMNVLGQRATVLEPGGVLKREGKKLLWNGEPVQLMGFSLYGMLANTRHDIPAYLDVLEDRGINFTREWCFEQWTALALHKKVEGRPGYKTGLCPFHGESPASLPGEPYDLERLNDDFFTHLRDFVQAAWERGIVVQVSLFERNGMTRKSGNPPGRWTDSPFNRANNQQGYLEISGQSTVPRGFTGTEDIDAVNQAFVERVVDELRGFGNVIYELMNEPQQNMPDAATEERWHDRMAQLILEGGSGGPLRIADPAPQVVFEGDRAAFSAPASGGTGSYSFRWQAKPDARRDWFDLGTNPTLWKGEASALLEILAARPEHNGYQVRCRVEDEENAPEISAAASLTVEAESQDMVYIDLGSPDEPHGMRRPPREPANGKTEVADIGGRRCRRNLDPKRHSRMYFRVDDEWAFEGSQNRVEATIDYFDAGQGFLQLEYDGTNSNFTRAAKLRLGNSRQWKTHSWNLRDAFFGNRQNNGSDLRIRRSGQAEFFLDMVSLTVRRT